MQLKRLRGRKVNDLVLRRGNVWRGKHMMIRWIAGAPRHPAADPAASAVYAGVSASAKLSKSAVQRNRMRRRCREALRVTLLEQADMSPLQLLVAPRSSSLDSTFEELLNDCREFLLSVSSHG